MEQDARRNFRWNFFFITADAAAFIGGMAFFDPTAVLPIFISTLTDSTLVIGALITIQRAGWLLPQLFAASFLQHRPSKKPFLLLTATLGRLPFIGLALLTYYYAADNPALVLGGLILAFTIFWSTDGMSCLAWNDIIAKAVPANFRGRLFGAQQFIGAAIAIIAGLVVKQVLEGKGLAYPVNYALLCGILFAFMMLSSFFLALIREPIHSVAEEPQSVAQLLRLIPGALRERYDFRRMIITQLLIGIVAIAAPFYAVYAERSLGAPAWASGIFIWGGTAGGIMGSIVWAYLNDRHGSTWVIRSVCLLGILAPAVAIAVPLVGLSAPLVYYAYALVFAMTAAAGGGHWIGFTNYLMEVVRDEERPIYLGITPTICAPVILSPLLGGWLLNFFSYQTVFVVAGLGGLLALLSARSLPEPRHKLLLAEVVE